MSPFDARFVPHLRAAEDRHFWFVARNRILAALLSGIEPTLPADYRVLEVGCGDGNTLRVLEDVCRRGSVIGMDLHSEGLVVARRRVECPLIRGDVMLPPFGPTTRFDIIAMFDVLEHIEEDCDVLAAVRSMLGRDAVLLLTVPAGPHLWSAFDEAAGHRRRYTVNGLRAKLVETGFCVEYLSPFMAALYPIAWVRRRLARRPVTPEDAFEFARRDLRIVPVVNPLLRRILGREAGSISARARLPFGTSLIAIARRSDRTLT
jgi:SAM-dependent methyltransferase